jgi:sugar O-acyltransferase (sialic acid O-acetyltransferase NeuD family)
LTVDEKFLSHDKKWGLPIVPFETLELKFSPKDYYMFVAVGYQELNQVREKKCLKAKKKGFSLVSCIGDKANIPSDLIYGENCFIMDNVMIHPCVQLGMNNFIWSGVTIGHHSKIGNHCWFTSSSQIAGGVSVGDRCFFSINSTISNQLKIGDDCFFGANSLVTKCTMDKQVYLQQSTSVHRLNSRQFLKLTCFDYK